MAEAPYIPSKGEWVVVLEVSPTFESRDILGRCFQVLYNAWPWHVVEAGCAYACCHLRGIPKSSRGAICRVRPALPHEEAAARLRDKP